MSLSRRTILRASAATLALPAIARHGFAEEPIRVGWLATFTGPLSSPTIGFDRGVQWAVAQINGAGGVNGRMIEVISRDTQGDPTKAVNATQDVISRQKVHAIFGPVNSGELLATTPIMARARMPSLVAGVVNSLIDPVKFPNAFRVTPSNIQWDGAVRNYCVNILKAKKVAVLADATGYGTSAHDDSVAGFKKAGIDVAYDGVIDPSQPDVTPDLLRAKNAGAQVLVSWTVSAGMAARMMNARAALNWDVPIVGHPALGTGEIGKLVSKPEYWDKVYQVGYRNCSYGPDGKLPPANQQFVDSVRGKMPLADTSLWWICSGVDAIRLIAEAVQKTGSSDSGKIIGYWNTLQMWPGLYGHYSFTPQEHNGFLDSDVVMSKANSQRDGAFDLAPGYS
ncbi:ABC transporter substrate-binding protein [Rhodopila sp.]|jgi:branched-chain amino acid transport system substrate-binding protein|uniref:ABC transporter substrate-binding protein n=1 Tax=Rhodopila sp. TaxID=2480087 RepID=UPI002CF2F4BB|nr:ABC transporter substrate-binding protein [Rhodopila sp.]HVZ09769.1 ABC transporter substrate-binding protein [Rhodopila sp.]